MPSPPVSVEMKTYLTVVELFRPYPPQATEEGYTSIGIRHSVEVFVPFTANPTLFSP